MSTLVIVVGSLSFLVGVIALLVGDEDFGRLRQWIAAREMRWGVAAPVAAVFLMAVGIVLLRYWTVYRDYL